MTNRYSTCTNPALSKTLVTALFGIAVLVTVGCKSPERNEGLVVNGPDAVALPTDTLLNLSCADVGIFAETCVLDDPDNPFARTSIIEFDANNPDATNKFELVNSIPAGAIGAKARFYFWATALARRQSGENQWYTARALHELWDVAGDPIVQAQALRAYRSVLENFFGSVTFFECCAGLNPTSPGDPVAFPFQLNELVADNLYRSASTNWARLVPGDPLLTLELIGQWGFTYVPATPPDFNDGVLSVNDG